MQPIRPLLATLLLAACALPAAGQTIKTLGYNSTNGNIVYSGTNTLTFTNTLVFGDDVSGSAFETSSGSNSVRFDSAGVTFGGSAAAATRANLGFSTNLNTLWTATNASNARAAIGLASSNSVSFEVVNTTSGLRVNNGTNEVVYIGEDISEFTTPIYAGGEITFSTNGASASATRTNLGLGSTNIVTFAGLTNNGDIRINQTATNNGLLYIYRTNAEPFLGLANLIASNNTTVSNETLFRVGVSEATNKSAQFGFRSTNTNGNGVAVFSVFGYNALMMIGPSDPNAGTNPIQATIYSIAPTNKVMTLITTNTGAMQMHRPIGIDTAGVSTNAPANTTNVAGWIQFYVGTNSVRVPYYQ